MGVRCWGDRYAYVVLSGSKETPVLVASKHVRLLVNANRGEQLSGFRQDLYDILTQHQVEAACFKCHEPIAQTKSVPRGELEGVLQETCFSHRPSVPVLGRTFKQLKSVLQFGGAANHVVQAADCSEFSKLGKTNFAEAIVAALASLV
jgi:hypothetical protein